MSPVSKVIDSIFLAAFLTFTISRAINLPKNKTSNEDNSLKIYLVEDIIRKVCNLSLDTFSSKNSAEKAQLLIKIEKKLNKSASALGIRGAQYVNLIMKGVRSKAFEDGGVGKVKKTMESNEVAEIGHILREQASIQELTARRNDPDSNIKRSLVQNITEKIETLSRGYLSKAKTPEERAKVIENIKKTFLIVADRKNSSSDSDIKNYVDLVTKGIELAMRKDLINRRRAFTPTNNASPNKNSEDRKSSLDKTFKTVSLQTNGTERERNYSKSHKTVFTKINNKTTSVNISCESIIKESCSKIKLLKSLKCLSDNKEFNILKLCDGVVDCLDFSDEIQCGPQAMETIHKGNQLLAYVNNSINDLHCFSDLLHKKMLSTQNEVLSHVLSKQLSFLEKHFLNEPETVSRRVYNIQKNVVMETVNEAMNIVDSLTSSMGMSMCPNFEKDRMHHMRFDKEELEREIRLATEPTTDVEEHCKCNGRNCLQACSPRCKRICYDMYSLSQFACDAVTGDAMVSIDVLCDGKLDCYEEFDEKDCIEDVSLAKFEATHMYDYILNDIKYKTVSMTSEAVRSRLQTLYSAVTKLQKISLKRNPNILEVKRVRQACFEELSNIYDTGFLHLKSNVFDWDELRFFLITLNERLISALKRSHTGNERIISSDGCLCRDDKCVLAKCSKSCIRACSAETHLTRFFCGEPTAKNNSLPLELVCNGKANCPNGEDEKGCKKDVCRVHHLKVLRRKLQDVGKRHVGTALGEALRAWRVKVTATLMVSEDNERPSQMVLYNILHNILHDLVMAYATLENRKNNAPILKEFYYWSRVVIDTLKSCSQ